ncbi:MAG: DUF1573 domain-containing protein [Phycisphaerales bacterium]|nr:MAG: DUF1573 domain-containing protein [Phycisphaerales bacterium]
MKREWIILTVVLAMLVLLVPAGCQQQAETPREAPTGSETPKEPPVVQKEEPTPVVSMEKPEPKTTQQKPQESNPEPRIRFEKIVHDFGDVGPGSANTCEFRFMNVGKGTLRITNVTAPCGCTVPELKKKDYKPGESGLLRVTYTASTLPGVARKYAYVHSNDKQAPKVTLTITAKITPKVTYEPKRLNILLKDDKPECPQITLTSADGKPFSVTAFTVAGNAITAEIDPAVEATKFILQPKVNPDRLQRSTNGVIELSLTHPQCKRISIPFDALPKFKINPPVIILWDVKPEKPVQRDVWVLNNYEEDFQIESVTASNKFAKLLGQEKIRNGYKLKVEITPPPMKDVSRFTDVLFVKIKNSDEKLGITCRGFYAKNGPPVP